MSARLRRRHRGPRASPSPAGREPVRAVDGVIAVRLPRARCSALLGESGSGKSVTLRSLLRLHPEKRSTMTGAIAVAGRDVLALPNASWRTCAAARSR